ncbi:hypothetical protein M0812_20421 [Anaeramoeba flamelloides]|uniref:Mitochondrial mRNA-processing protein COX24 C-terminal domain-containing protein n=1 Tax=Anaeramoeba flamelloides TaxID=1746091 RepID=A0AAV7YRT4_9EUKA|nr:hypothetical protein M0812_20421 [Anaeramoeba flamelloides]
MYKKTIFTRSLEIFQENTPNSTVELIKQLNLQTRNIPQPVLEFYRNDDQLTPPQQPSNLIRVGSQKKKDNSLYKTKAVNTKNKKVRSVGGSFKRKTMMLDTTTAVSISKSNKEEILKEKRRRRMKRTKNDHYFNDELRKRKRKEKK